MILEPAAKKGAGIWIAETSPNELMRLGPPKSTVGTRSVLLVEGAEYDSERKRLEIDVTALTVLNLGTGRDALVVTSHGDDRVDRTVTDTNVATTDTFRGPPLQDDNVVHGPGDLEFLRLVNRELRGNPLEAAIRILKEVRRRNPGDLQRGKRSNFKNIPDNFWYVIVQPRVQSLSITIRGEKEQIHAQDIELKDDRPGYTRFTLARPDQVPEALAIIRQSKRHR
jgi:hypothetical protein